MTIADLLRLPALLWVLALGATVWAQEDALPTPLDTDGPAGAIRAAIQDYVAAYNRHDASQVAARWTEDGIYVDEQSGSRLIGREAIQADFAALFAEGPDARLDGQIDAIRLIRPDVAHVSGRAVVVQPGQEPRDSAFTAVVVRDGDQWLIGSVNERLLPAASRPDDHLQVLEFLVGRWVDDLADVRVDTTVRWSLNRAFLVRSYTVQRGDDDVEQGTQVIGWDPREQRIRSWTFDSSGAFGAETWSPGEDGWTVKITQTLPDGRVAAGTQIISNISENAFTVQSVGQEIEGDAMPSSDPVRVVRADDLAVE